MEGTIDYQRLAQELLAQQVRTKAVSGTPTTTYGHGQGGLFSQFGMSQDIVNAMVMPNLGIESILPVRPSNFTNPLYGIMTGVTATTGDEPDGVCDDPPTAGLMKLCTHSAVFGRQSRQSRVFEINRFGQITNRGEFSDFNVIGDPLADSNIAGPGLGGANFARNEIAKAVFELGVAWRRDFAREIYTGNPTNNTAGGGREYFYGLDILINTGRQDAVTGVACPAADSIVRSFGNANVRTNGTAFVRDVTNMYRNLQYIANAAGLAPARWALTMRWALFYELTEVWPCEYMTYRCSTGTGGTNMVDSQALIEMRDEMRGDIFNRTGQYLLIDGQRVPVVIDDGITETEGFAGGAFRSSIYFIPLTVLGGRPVTWLEYFNYDSEGGAAAAAREFAPGSQFWTTNNGRFLWHAKPPTNWCVQYLAKTEPRLILLTPHLAARLTNIAYSPVAHERSPFTDSAYFVDGGQTSYGGYGPSYYSPTA